MRLILRYCLIAILIQVVHGNVLAQKSEKVIEDPILKKMTKAIKKDSKNPDLYYQRAKYYFDKEDYEHALEDYQASVNNNLKTSGIFTSIGYCYARLNDQKLAVVNLSTAIELDPKNIEAYGHRAYSYLIQKLHESAEADYRHFLQVKPNDAVAHFGLARSLEFQNKNKEALEEYILALKNNNQFIEAQYRTGIMLGKLGDYGQAIECFNAAINMDSKNGEYYYNRAIAKGRMKEDYCPDFQKAMELGYEGAKKMLDEYCK